MDATERAANSATPVMGASKKLRPITSATTSIIMRKIQTVPTAAITLAGPCSGLLRPATAGVSEAKSGSLCTGHLRVGGGAPARPGTGRWRAGKGPQRAWLSQSRSGFTPRARSSSK
ncbi:hypothetical protein D9M68_951730 [compost metagenome]